MIVTEIWHPDENDIGGIVSTPVYGRLFRVNYSDPFLMHALFDHKGGADLDDIRKKLLP
jgi:hypothetical protein